MLQVVDSQWKDHLYGLDHLKEGIGLRGYGQRNPLVEYKRESFTMFQAMKQRIDEETLRYLWRLRPVAAGRRRQRPTGRLRSRLDRRRRSRSTIRRRSGVRPWAAASASGGAGPRPARTGGDDAPVRTVRRDVPKVGRNQPCPCGSGKKYKKCHGA